MEDAIKSVKGKLQLLQLTDSKTQGIVEKGNTEAILRHKEALLDIIKAVESLKRDAEQAKLDAGENPEGVAAWGLEIEQQVSKVDNEITYLNNYVAEAEQMEQAKKKEKENVEIARAREEQLEFERAQLELKLEFERKLEETRKDQSAMKSSHKEHTKLPKLQITKFNGTYGSWLPFWNKFQAEIEATDLAQVTKFAYLKELVEPNVRALIEGLPFTTEGYERAKNILKSEYGKNSEIVNAYVQNIMSLPTITGSHPVKVHEFYMKLLYNVQSLETLGKLREVSGIVRSVIDKLKGIKADLVRGQDGWQEWDFPKLVQALKRWKDVNPIEVSEKPTEKPPHSRARSFQTQEHVNKPRGCVYCDADHKSINCDKFVSVADRKKQLGLKRLCFNCTGSKHRAAECRSRSVCQNCQSKHHTSICDKISEQLMTATSKEKGSVCHPIVVVEVSGIKCRALLDTGAGSSYASSALIDRLRVRPRRTEVRRIEMMIGAVTKRVQMYDLRVSSTKGDFTLEAEVTKVDRNELLTVENPKYKETISKYPHLKGVVMEDSDDKPVLPVHLILGTSEYARIKTESGPRIGCPGEPIAERTKFGWTMMSPGQEVDLNNMFLAQTSVADYESLCRLDVLGLEDSPTGDQGPVYSEFKEQLKRSPEGWYETGLPWKGNHPPLPNNEAGSLRRLNSLVRKLEKTEMLTKYNAVIQDQLEEGIVERVTSQATQREFYIPHKAVVRESAESTKLRIVYDASAKAHEKAPSLNDCLETGPPLQNQLWKVLVRNRFHPIAIAGDLKQAFLQVRIREEDRDALRFHWLKDLTSKRVETLRFTRALFGLAPSPFLLGGVIQQHLETCRSTDPEGVAEIEKSLYVDDLISGGQTIEQARRDVSETRDLWWRGPDWLVHPEKWPPDIVTSATQETLAEAKTVRELFKVAVAEKDEFDQLLAKKWSVWRTLRISAWVSRFTHNARSSKGDRVVGPLTTDEINKRKLFWERRVQQRSSELQQFQEERLSLNLQPNSEGILECRGRIQGVYPVYLPDSELYTEKQVQHAHEVTLHGGVGLTMAKVREQYWVPRLRRLAKRVIKRCRGCKRFQVTALASPPPGNLPRDRTEGTAPFQVVGVDYAGPIKYTASGKKEGKAYIIVYACSLTRALYLDLVSTMETEEFLRSLKRLVARKGRPEKLYSDNGMTFVAAAKWVKKVMQDERLNDSLARMNIKWQFNLSRAPWWGGQFERMVGLVKRALHKTIGNGTLAWRELEEVIIDVEVTLNNRPLSYVEEDVQLPLLTPNALQFGRPNLLPEQEDHHIQERDLRKRAKYLRKCKDVLWGRWTSEYLKGLRERHNLKHDTKQLSLSRGDVVLIKGDERNRGKWKLGVVEALFPGRDGVVRAAKLRAGKTYMERALQHLYPMELSCDRAVLERQNPTNADPPEPAPRRAAAQDARQRIQAIARCEQAEL